VGGYQYTNFEIANSMEEMFLANRYIRKRLDSHNSPSPPLSLRGGLGGVTEINVDIFIHSSEPISKSISPEKSLMPAKAGIQKSTKKMDSRRRGNNEKRPDEEEAGF